MDFADSTGENLGIHREHGHRSRHMLGYLEQKKLLSYCIPNDPRKQSSGKQTGRYVLRCGNPTLQHETRLACVGLQGEESIVSILGAIAGRFIHLQARIILHAFSIARLMDMS